MKLYKLHILPRPEDIILKWTNDLSENPRYQTRISFWMKGLTDYYKVSSKFLGVSKMQVNIRRGRLGDILTNRCLRYKTNVIISFPIFYLKRAKPAWLSYYLYALRHYHHLYYTKHSLKSYFRMLGALKHLRHARKHYCRNFQQDKKLSQLRSENDKLSNKLKRYRHMHNPSA